MPTDVLMEFMLYPLVYLDVRKLTAYFRKEICSLSLLLVI